MSGAAAPDAPPHRAGVVAIVGLPNAGKSTLLNALLGEKLAIVTAKPQTTRSRILGIHTLPHAQILFLDTPGLVRGARPLDQALAAQIDHALRDCDVAILLVDLCAGWREEHAALRERLARQGTPVLVVGSKADRPGADALPWPPPGVAAADALRISAQRGEGLGALVDALTERLPIAPRLYPEDELSDRPLRFLAAELVREAAFEELAQELPYVLAVEVVSFDESRASCVHIRANLLVERQSQRGIVIGRGGAMIRKIGTRARAGIEALLGRHVHLELRVEVEPRWTRRPTRFRQLGYF
jgi:GTP-binding protein Era